MRRLLASTAALYTWLGATLAGLIAAVALGTPGWALMGWTLGGLAAVAIAATSVGR